MTVTTDTSTKPTKRFAAKGPARHRKYRGDHYFGDIKRTSPCTWQASISKYATSSTEKEITTSGVVTLVAEELVVVRSTGEEKRFLLRPDTTRYVLAVKSQLEIFEEACRWVSSMTDEDSYVFVNWLELLKA